MFQGHEIKVVSGFTDFHFEEVNVTFQNKTNDVNHIEEVLKKDGKVYGQNTKEVGQNTKDDSIHTEDK